MWGMLSEFLLDKYLSSTTFQSTGLRAKKDVR